MYKSKNLLNTDNWHVESILNTNEFGLGVSSTNDRWDVLFKIHIGLLSLEIVYFKKR